MCIHYIIALYEVKCTEDNVELMQHCIHDIWLAAVKVKCVMKTGYVALLYIVHLRYNHHCFTVYEEQHSRYIHYICVKHSVR